MVILSKCIYGLVHAARKYNKKDVKILKNSGFVGGSIDPCLYVKKSVKVIVYIALYVDDNLMIGDMATINNAIKAFKNKELVPKIVEGLQDYLSCKIMFFKGKKRAWLGQWHLIKNMEKKFGKLVQDVQSYKTPSAPKFLIIRPMVESKKISMKDQLECQSGIDMLLYLVKQNCQKQTTMQTLQSTRNTFVLSGMCCT